MIKTVNISSPAARPVTQRRSVIVRREETRVLAPDPVTHAENTTIEIEFEDNIKSENEDFSEETDENNSVKLSLNVAELENLFTLEEKKYFAHSLSQFVGAWKSVSFGEKFINMYTSFCQNKGMLPYEFLKLINSALR